MKNDSGYYGSNKINLLAVAIVLLVINLGCNFSCGKFEEIDLGKVSEDANKLVREGNASAEKAAQAGTKAEALETELLSSENLKKVEDFEKYKQDNKDKFDELIRLSEDAAKEWEESAAKFEQVSKMNVNEKFREFNTTLAAQNRRTAEINKVNSAFARAFLAEKDPEKYSSMFLEHNKKFAEMIKERDALREKAAKIKNDNPDVFKK